MAYIPGQALQTRLREVLEDGAGAYRTIASSRFRSGLYEGLGIPAATLRALGAPITEATVTGFRPSPDSPNTMHSLHIFEVEVEVKIIRSADLTHKLDSASRDALKGAALVDADAVRQACVLARNLSATTAGTSTGLISGRLNYEGASFVYDLGSATSAHIETTVNLSGHLRVTAATS